MESTLLYTVQEFLRGSFLAAKGLALEVLPNAALALDEPQLLDPCTIFAILKSSARRRPILVIFRSNLEGDKPSKRQIGILKRTQAG